MARKDIPSDQPAVTQVDVALPRPARREEPGPPVPRRRAGPKALPATHGERMLGAGAAFAAYAATQGIDPSQRATAATLTELQAAFEARPVLGHRRSGSSGDNHRSNPEHIRK